MNARASDVVAGIGTLTDSRCRFEDTPQAYAQSVKGLIVFD